ncbi:hypothetical protein Tco_1409536, partial [Tanacetum coccineum]
MRRSQLIHLPPGFTPEVDQFEGNAMGDIAEKIRLEILNKIHQFKKIKLRKFSQKAQSNGLLRVNEEREILPRILNKKRKISDSSHRQMCVIDDTGQVERRIFKCISEQFKDKGAKLSYYLLKKCEDGTYGRSRMMAHFRVASIRKLITQPFPEESLSTRWSNPCLIKVSRNDKSWFLSTAKWLDRVMRKISSGG